MSAAVESRGKARTKYEVYRWLGWLLLLSLLVTVPLLIHYGGQTYEEGDTEGVNMVGRLFLAVAVGVILGPAFLMTAGHYTGVKKLRFVRDDGSRTVWVRGHRLF
ncbi:hypothetical protein [Streptomyces xanthophaeus]|uniref:hypothetical protein n=1 Tax=Streptomyces xanthophaeus TaxID=67385 RepID=UPI0026489B63|nr:hypothetical protein [Streptomyces xanthophaeus]WKD36968.1 hypothetical protein KO717_36945 [Streptomyces xanthophaeus]